MRSAGARALRAAAWLFGDEPVERFLVPLVADAEAEASALAAQGDAARAAQARRRACVAFLFTLPHVVVRTQPRGAARWGVPALIAGACSLFVLESIEPVTARAQATWLVIGALVFAGTRALGRRWLEVPPKGAFVLAVLAVLPAWIAGERWLRLGHTWVVWSELARPVFLLCVGLLLEAPQRGRVLERALGVPLIASVWYAAGVRTSDPSVPLVYGAAACAALAGRRAPGTRAASIACAALGLAAMLFAVPEWGLVYLGSSPPAHTDGLLSILAARSGPNALVLPVGALVGVALAPVRASSRPMARAFSAALFVQMFAYVSAALHALPSLGLALPLLSYSGSAVVGLLASLGLVAGISHGETTSAPRADSRA